MKIMILANPDSVHTRKWISSLSAKGIEIILYSLHDSDMSFYNGLNNFKYYSAGFSSSLNFIDDKIGKLKYIKAVREIKKVIKLENIDILHSHYASSFGLVGALCNFHPFIISVWGSDVFEFPRSSIIARKVLEFSLGRADKVLSTSTIMANETKKYCKKDIYVTPFGVDTEKFIKDRRRFIFEEDDIIIGTIKTLEKVYGINHLIKAFSTLVNRNPDKPLKLLIVGDGSCENDYKKLADELNISEKTHFAGYINHNEIVKYYNNFDIFVVYSIRESFGVSVLEASSCELPVVASDVGGLPEVIIDGETGILVPPENSDILADAVERLVDDKALQLLLGSNGRKMVEEKYKWNLCVEKMIEIYNGVLK
jgi:glycosyltransferase involved in cell wall biosynthesis